jgi:hypothetical protein
MISKTDHNVRTTPHRIKLLSDSQHAQTNLQRHPTILQYHVHITKNSRIGFVSVKSSSKNCLRAYRT